MHGLAKIPVEGGEVMLFEITPGWEEVPQGPVKAGRVADAARELPRTLQETLAPVRDTARTVVEELRRAGPDEVEVEFGVNLSAQVGAVITKGETACHLKVRMLWKREGPSPEVNSSNRS
ncbi:CU044_2847 family protein [Streptomyces avermitilis]|uniref:CU044_2847 family protein n=1 Tax=Streptomyces avermitilis TaxID=33903 RepID=UPI003810D419